MMHGRVKPFANHTLAQLGNKEEEEEEEEEEESNSFILKR